MVLLKKKLCICVSYNKLQFANGSSYFVYTGCSAVITFGCVSHTAYDLKSLTIARGVTYTKVFNFVKRSNFGRYLVGVLYGYTIIGIIRWPLSLSHSSIGYDGIGAFSEIELKNCDTKIALINFAKKLRCNFRLI